MKQCPNCSAKNTDNAAFCESCGVDLRNVAIMPDERSTTVGDFLNKAKEAATTGAKKAKEAAETGTAKVKAYQAEQEAHQRELLKGVKNLLTKARPPWQLWATTICKISCWASG